MKKKVLILLCCIAFGTLIAQNYQLKGEYLADLVSVIDEFKINNNRIIYTFKDGNGKKEVSFKEIHKDGLLFLQLSEKLPYDTKGSNPSNLVLVLAGNYSSDNNMSSGILFAETSGFNYVSPFVSPSTKFCDSLGRQYTDCSSFLKEKNREYKVGDLCNCKPGTPWVEGVAGSGIGEGFTIKNEFPALYGNPNPYLLIMNGYISYDKPYLYKQNNRIKKIKVTGVKSGKTKILDVLDTPHPQTVDISFITEPEDIRVEIADVYKGTKYDDTCINFCVTYYDKVIPYENSVR